MSRSKRVPVAVGVSVYTMRAPPPSVEDASNAQRRGGSSSRVIHVASPRLSAISYVSITDSPTAGVRSTMPRTARDAGCQRGQFAGVAT